MDLEGRVLPRMSACGMFIGGRSESSVGGRWENFVLPRMSCVTYVV